MSKQMIYTKRNFLLAAFFLLLCLLSNARAEIQSESAMTPEMMLEEAIKNGQLDDVRLLLENGANLNQKFNDGSTPLHAAVVHNQENIAILLIQSGADVNATDSTTQATPLHLAALYGRVKIAEFLIKKKADINAKMRFSITPLLVAAQFNQAEIIQLLLANKANIRDTDEEGFSALHLAAQNGDAVVARMLMDKGADLNLADKTNKATPLAIAIENNHPEVAHLLQEKGAE